MEALIILGVGLGLLLTGAFTYSMCAMAAPADAEAQRLNDEEQLEYLRRHKR